MIVFNLDIPSLTKDKIQLIGTFDKTRNYDISSMIDGLIMIEMLIRLTNSFT